MSIDVKLMSTHAESCTVRFSMLNYPSQDFFSTLSESWLENAETVKCYMQTASNICSHQRACFKILMVFFLKIKTNFRQVESWFKTGKIWSKAFDFRCIY